MVFSLICTMSIIEFCFYIQLFNLVFNHIFLKSCLEQDGNSKLEKLNNSSQGHRHYCFNIRCASRNSLQGTHSSVFSVISTVFAFARVLSANITNKLGSWWRSACCFMCVDIILFYSSGKVLFLGCFLYGINYIFFSH